MKKEKYIFKFSNRQVHIDLKRITFYFANILENGNITLYHEN